MAPRISLLILSLYFFGRISSQSNGHDATIRTMEEFSGYQIHEPRLQDSSSPSSSLSVDTDSLQKQIDELSNFSDTPSPSVTRILYSEKDVQARGFVKNLMTRSGLSVREDAVGNIFGRWEI